MVGGSSSLVAVLVVIISNMFAHSNAWFLLYWAGMYHMDLKKEIKPETPMTCRKKELRDEEEEAVFI